MPKLYSARKVIKTLNKTGFKAVSQRGSHIKLQKVVKGKTLTVIVPDFKEIPKGTFASILRQAELNREEFEKLTH